MIAFGFWDQVLREEVTLVNALQLLAKYVSLTP
jgi:hypothetical protein